MIHNRKLGGICLQLAWAVLCLSAAHARADMLAVSVSGQFGSGVSADQLAGPNASWALSFAVDSNPAAANVDALSFDVPFSNFSYLLNSSAVAVSPDEIRVFTSGDGGLFTLFFGPETGFNNGIPIPEFSFSGDQVFSGATATPTITPGSYPVGDTIYSDELNFDDEAATATVTIAAPSVGSPVPEPST